MFGIGYHVSYSGISQSVESPYMCIYVYIYIYIFTDAIRKWIYRDDATSRKTWHSKRTGCFFFLTRWRNEVSNLEGSYRIYQICGSGAVGPRFPRLPTSGSPSLVLNPEAIYIYSYIYIVIFVLILICYVYLHF